MDDTDRGAADASLRHEYAQDVALPPLHHRVG